MTPELLRATFEEKARQVPVPDLADRALKAAHRRRKVRLLGGPPVAAVVIAVVAIAVGSVGLFRPGSPHMVSPASGPGTLPQVIAPVPAALPLVTRAPLGRAALVYRGPLVNYAGEKRNDVPIAAGADSDSSRLLPLPAVSSHGYHVTSYALAPDGTRVAYGWAPSSYAEVTRGTVASALKVVDLRTGEISSHSLPGVGYGEDVKALAWSPDGHRIAYAATQIEVEGGNWHGAIQLRVLDLATGTDTLVPGAAPGTAIAWSPDGQRLAIDVPSTAVIDLHGRTIATVTSAGAHLPSQNAWSPDGEVLALMARLPGPGETDTSIVGGVSRPYEVHFVSVADNRPVGVGVVRFGPAQDAQFLGWRDADHAVVSQVLPDGSTEISLVSIRDGTLTPLIDAPADARVYEVQIARDILASASMRDANRGKTAAADVVGYRWEIAWLVRQPGRLVG